MPLRPQRALGALCLLIAACRPEAAPPPPDAPAPPAEAAGPKVTALADAYVHDFFEAFPYMALELGAAEVHPDRLADHSLPALQRWQAREDELLRQLHEIDAAPLEGRAEGITYAFLDNLLQSAQGFRACRMELWNVSPTFSGWQADLPVVAGMQATATAEDQRHAVARFSELPKYLDDEIQNLQEGLRLGYTAPRHNVQTVISQIDGMLAAKVSESPFVQMAKGGEGGAENAEFRAQLEALETPIRAAMTRYRDFLRDTYLAKAREAIGVSANPEGAACYRAAVRYAATVDMAPEEVHALGKEQVAKIEAEMQAIGARSFGTADVPALLNLVKTDRKYLFAGRKELIAAAESAVERARQALPRFFGRLPKAPVIVEPYPAYIEKSAPGGQAVPPTPDGRPGKYLINAYEAEKQSRAGLESTAFHEAYPGHHLQVTLALERSDLHAISRYFFLSGFGEGWALYSERLADEMGLFSSDVDRLGLLSNEALRAARLVVDSGMHALGWTRQQAIDYLVAHTAEPPARAASEIDRYIAVPGQATAYMIGNLEIRRLRGEAERALGERFDLKAFHDLVLADGTLPLSALRAKVQRWVKRT